MEKVKSTIKVIANTLLLLLLIEVILRIFFPAKATDQLETSAFTPHSEFLVTLKARVQKEYIHSEINGGRTIPWRSNEDGFRGGKLQKRDYRIMVYGDSNIHARFSKLENTFAHQLQSMLNQNSSQSIEVVNAGVVGFGPDQSLLKFIEEVPKLKPDMVILQIFADNDFGDLIRNRLFEVDEHGNLVPTDHKRIQDPSFQDFEKRAKPWRYLRIMDGVRKIRRTFHSNKEGISAKKMIAICNQLSKEALDTYNGKNDHIQSHFADHYDIDVATKPSSLSAQKKIILMEKIIEQFRMEAADKNIKLLVLIEPSSVDLTTNGFLSHKELTQEFPEYRPTNLTNFIEQICSKNDIPYINLYAPFLQSNPERFYFRKGNDHWTDKAQQLAAKISSDYIQKEMLP